MTLVCAYQYGDAIDFTDKKFCFPQAADGVFGIPAGQSSYHKVGSCSIFVSKASFGMMA